MKRILSLFLYFLLFLIYLASPIILHHSTFANNILFQDNFDDGDANGWIIIRNLCGSTWSVKDGRYSNSIIGRDCVTESVPEDSLWDNAWQNYSLEVDITPMSGGDWNLAFRFIDINNWYGLHFRYDEVILQKVLEGIQPAPLPIYYSHTFRPGFTYHIKVIVEGNNIKVFIDHSTVPLIDYTDEGTVIGHGKPALQASAGGIPSSWVYFDNVVVKSLDHEEEERQPIVLIPGHGASWCLSAILTGAECAEWQMTPFIKVYDNLIATLENADYVQNQDLFIFYYDWRKRIDSLADELAAFIADKIPGGEQALLVGHSMGGLVSRAYLQKTINPPIAKLLTIGSPHQGVPIAYPAWAGGEIWNDNTWQWLGLQLLLQIHKNGFATNMEALRYFAPSTQDFLPIFNYLLKDNQEIDVNTMTHQNNWLKTLTATEDLATLNGDQQQTLAGIDVEDSSWLDEYLGKWSDGKPQNKRFSSQGDATVLLASASINNVPNETLNLQHSGLISATGGLEKIIELLGLNISTIVNQTQAPAAQPALVFFLHSPASLNLQNPPANTIVSQEDNLIIIPNPSSGQYQLQVTGIASGSYHLEVGQITADETLWQTLAGDTYPGKQETLVINFDPSHPQENPLVDADGSLNLNIAKTKIKELKHYINQLNIRVAIKNSLIYSLDKVLRSLEINPSALQLQRSLADLYQLRININQWQKYNLLNASDSVYLRNSLMDIIAALENSYVRLMIQSGQAADQSRIQGDLQTVTAILSRLQPKVNNKDRALVYELAQEKLNQAEKEFIDEEYYYAQILVYSGRMLTTELSQLAR